jgi:hypothetical protein
MSNNKVINSWDWDIRVRERNLRNGILTDKDIEKQRGTLPDLADQAEPVTLAQPALANSAAEAASASVPPPAPSEVEDDEDDDEEEVVEAAAEAANGSSSTLTNVSPSTSNVSEGS